jgi:hypothetical protein
MVLTGAERAEKFRNNKKHDEAFQADEKQRHREKRDNQTHQQRAHANEGGKKRMAATRKRRKDERKAQNGTPVTPPYANRRSLMKAVNR